MTLEELIARGRVVCPKCGENDDLEVYEGPQFLGGSVDVICQNCGKQLWIGAETEAQKEKREKHQRVAELTTVGLRPDVDEELDLSY